MYNKWKMLKMCKGLLGEGGYLWKKRNSADAR